MFVERTYIHLACSTLPKFKQKTPDLYQMRCNICGDSEMHQSKSRAYIYNKKGDYWYHCHNCNLHISFKSYLKRINTLLYEEYLRETLLEKYGKKTSNKTLIVKPKLHEKTIFSEIPRISDLFSSHPAKKYLLNRLIPENKMSELFYCEKFQQFTNQHLPGKFPDIQYDEARIIIPLYSQFGKVYGYQGRSLDPKNKLRYITILLNDDNPRIYGADHVDFNKQFYCFEGPFDSLFVQNSIASCGGTLITDLISLGVNHHNSVIIYDNEKRNKSIVTNIKKTISAGFKVVIWPDDFYSKDINDAIISGHTTESIMTLIQDNIYHGLAANLRLSEWAKI